MAYTILLALLVALLCVACFVSRLCSFFFLDPKVPRKNKVRAGWAIFCSFMILSVARYPELGDSILALAIIAAFLGVLWASSPVSGLLFERMLMALHKLFFPDGYSDEPVGSRPESESGSVPRGRTG